jgi:hypothetical protein
VTSAPVVAVLGYSRGGSGDLHPVCARRLEHAQRLAASSATVILSGEAEPMRAAWSGPDVVLVCDPEARSTADNARNIARAALALDADELVVITSRWHGLRAAVLLRAAFRGTGIRFTLAMPDGPRPVLLLARELACLALLPVQLRRVLARR